jgi:hypothetical protein
MLLDNLSGFYEHELAWVSDLRRGLAKVECREEA